MFVTVLSVIILRPIYSWSLWLYPLEPQSVGPWAPYHLPPRFWSLLFPTVVLSPNISGSSCFWKPYITNKSMICWSLRPFSFTPQIHGLWSLLFPTVLSLIDPNFSEHLLSFRSFTLCLSLFTPQIHGLGSLLFPTVLSSSAPMIHYLWGL